MLILIALTIVIASVAAISQPAPLSFPLIQKIHTGQDLAEFWSTQPRSTFVDNHELKLLQYIYRKDYLLTNASIGLPTAQDSATCLKLESFQLAIETGSPSTFVFSPNFRLLAASQKPYFSNKSLTSDYVGGAYSAKSGTLKLSGTSYKDVFKTHSALYKTSFGVINKVQRADNFGQVGFPVDGVLGLSWTRDNDVDQPIKHICESVYGSTASCWYSFWLGPHKPPSRGESEGKLMFRNWDYQLCSSDFVQYMPLTYTNNNAIPTFQLTGFSFGDVITTAAAKSVTIDSGYSEIILPADEYNAVMNTINPDYDTPTNLLVVKCDSQLPDLTFVLEGGQILTVTKHQYLLDMDLSDSNCAVAIGQQLPTSMASDYVLGNPFLRSYCVAYNASSDGTLHIDIRDSLTSNALAIDTTQSVIMTAAITTLPTAKHTTTTAKTTTTTTKPPTTTSKPPTTTAMPTTTTAEPPTTTCSWKWITLMCP